jgi:hypothetical protein
MLVMDRPMAQGFVALLGGGGGAVPEQPQPASSKKKKSNGSATTASTTNNNNTLDDSAVTLGFLALTEGNSIEACFGVSSITMKDARGTIYAKEVKRLLIAAADSNDDIRRLSVSSYQEAFRIVIKFHDKSKKMNCLVHCFCFGKLQKKTMKQLAANFEHLEEAIHTAL